VRNRKKEGEKVRKGELLGEGEQKLASLPISEAVQGTPSTWAFAL
jgi:hypothetical protein